MPCIFCGADAKLSREHVFPQWLRELFPDLGEADYLRRIVTFSTDEHHVRPGAPFDVVVRDVCRDCNPGWMEKLQTRPAPSSPRCFRMSRGSWPRRSSTS